VTFPHFPFPPPLFPPLLRRAAKLWKWLPFLVSLPLLLAPALNLLEQTFVFPFFFRFFYQHYGKSQGKDPRFAFFPLPPPPFTGKRKETFYGPPLLVFRKGLLASLPLLIPPFLFFFHVKNVPLRACLFPFFFFAFTQGFNGYRCRIAFPSPFLFDFASLLSLPTGS